MLASRLTALTATALCLAAAAAAPASAAPHRHHHTAAGAGAGVSARARAASAASSRNAQAVPLALTHLYKSGSISEAQYLRFGGAFTAAQHSLHKLTGTRQAELASVLANVQAIGLAGQITPSRAPALFLTLERNRQWWSTEPLLSADERVSFPGSRIVWEYYPGQGIEIQWLATFGEANGYFLAGNENANLRQLLGEVIPLATQRAGGIAWEYLFHFDGGAPPWTSGLSQGTALQVLARAWSRFKEPAYLTAAQQALGIFEQPPPQGVRVTTPAGAIYAEYTYAPSDRILNGFIQALVGLYDYTSITQDPVGLSLFEAGDAEARALVPHYDTGYWSLYDQFGESDLNYHELLTEFLVHLCERTRKGPPAVPTTAPGATPSTTTTTPTTTTTTPAAPPATGETGGVSAGAARARSAQATATATPIAGDQIYCTTAQRFTADEKTPPLISLISTRLRGGTRAGVQLSLSKISDVQMTVRQGTRVVWHTGATVAGGKPRLLWITPARGGSFAVTLTATDLAGNFATASGTIAVSRH